MSHPAGRIGIFTSGMMRLAPEIAAMTGLAPTRRRRTAAGLAAVAAWGRRPTTRAAFAAAARAGLPVWSFEDGFLRSLAPGAAERSISYVLDRAGVYYDAAAPSDLEALIRARAADPAGAARDAAPALAALRRGLSKYNLFEPTADAFAGWPSDPAEAELLIDQTAGDASVIGAGAGETTFEDMLIEAAEDRQGGALVLKTHPETQTGRRGGHFTEALVARAAARSAAVAAAEAGGRLFRLTARVSPAEVFARVGGARTVSSLMGFEAMVHGLPVICHGAAFYAGWGLTRDRAPVPTARRGAATLEALTAAAFADHCRWFDPRSRRPLPLEDAIADLEARVRARGGLARS